MGMFDWFWACYPRCNDEAISKAMACQHNNWLIHSNGVRECLRCPLMIIPNKLKAFYLKCKIKVIEEEEEKKDETQKRQVR